MGCIDVHHHFFPDDINKEASNQKIGWRAPASTLPWTPDISLNAMDASGINLALLSLPAISAGSVSEENRATAREHNINLSRIVRAHPHRFGFFASLPFLDDVEGLYL
jgi:6-methylsalicylate decarboxylase